MDPTLFTTDENAQPDHLGVILFLAALIHIVVIDQLDFIPKLRDLRTPPALEVILVENKTDSKPEKADYIAANSQDGGGQSEDNTRPTSPFVSNQDLGTDGLAPTKMEAAAPTPQKQQADAVLTNLFADTLINSEISKTEKTPDIPRKSPIAIDQSMEIARLSAEINAQAEKYAKRPKKKFLNARTVESTAAEYMYKWVEKVERMGNLNYPDAARRENLQGALVLVVGIFKNGKIESVSVDESSGHKLLDDAAVRIVRMAAPFDALTGDLGKETDILYIVRTWEFLGNNEITSY